jgi:hypothetical protein
MPQPTGGTPGLEGVRADRLHGGGFVVSCGPGHTNVVVYPRLVHTTEAGGGWSDMALGRHLCPPPGRALEASRRLGQLESL